MKLPNTPRHPPVWSPDDLARLVRKSMDAFVERRLKEPRERYLAIYERRRRGLMRLFKALADIDPDNPDMETIREILLDEPVMDALRYVAGPPVSWDDLTVLVTRSPRGLTRAALREEDGLVEGVLKLICQISDSKRYPWIGEGRAPSKFELKQAIRATAALHATETLKTERRGYGRAVERCLKSRLDEMGFTRKTPPNKGKIESPQHWPPASTYHGESTVYGRKADVVIGLPDGRMVAVEAKDSSSALNSVKRILNDTAAKAAHWKGYAGKEIIPVALLSGVFLAKNLETAQESGLFLAWAHDLDSFLDWLSSQ